MTLAALGGCSSDTTHTRPPAGTGSSGSVVITGGSTSAGGSSSTGNGGTGNSVSVTPNGGANGGACQQAEVVFSPKYPAVFILVDRSGSMFDQQTDANGMQYRAWDRLKAATLPVIEQLQSQVRFGFGAFTGQNGGTCPDFPTIAPDFNNYAKISELYQPLDKPANTADKETPTGIVLPKVGDILWADPTDGSRYVLFITDGEPDYCDDGNALCPPDSVVYRLQQLAAGKDSAGMTHDSIKTFVLGLKASLSTVSDASLQAWANAGQGQPVALWGQAATDPNAMYDQCNGVAGWKTDFMATGKPAERGQTVGTYSPTGGTAKVYRPDAGDQTTLTNQIAALVNNVKTCTFDLQGKIKVDLTKQSEGKVTIDGKDVPFDGGAQNGWHMVTETQLELNGGACDDWRATGKKIDFDFPCDIIVIIR
ncbi:MAG TPA: vWA domain-containing protein [Polyangiaceae bacterium]|nr:vWA domain-containing protein [Polyangiaceae bacterium]